MNVSEIVREGVPPTRRESKSKRECVCCRVGECMWVIWSEREGRIFSPAETTSPPPSSHSPLTPIFMSTTWAYTVSLTDTFYRSLSLYLRTSHALSLFYSPTHTLTLPTLLRKKSLQWGACSCVGWTGVVSLSLSHTHTLSLSLSFFGFSSSSKNDNKAAAGAAKRFFFFHFSLSFCDVASGLSTSSSSGIERTAKSVTQVSAATFCDDSRPCVNVLLLSFVRC